MYFTPISFSQYKGECNLKRFLSLSPFSLSLIYSLFDIYLVVS